jgi:hypothetical protein
MGGGFILVLEWKFVVPACGPTHSLEGGRFWA